MKFYQSFLFYLAVALLIISPFSGYAIVMLVPFAIFILVFDYILRGLIKPGWRLRIAQIAVLPLFFLLLFIPKSDRAVYLKIKLSPGFVGVVSIYLGVEGAPPLPSDTATILIPPDGLFVTSTPLAQNEPLGTNMDQLKLAYFQIKTSATFNYCTKFTSIEYLVSNVDSVRSVPDTFAHGRSHLFHDSLVQQCIDKVRF